MFVKKRFMKKYSEYPSVLTRCQEQNAIQLRGGKMLIIKSTQVGRVRWEQPTNKEKPASHSPAYISPFSDRISADSWVPQTFIKCWNQIQ